YDELAQKHGWDKHLLFEQVVLLKNRPPKLVPIFYYHTPQPGPSVWIQACLHGYKEQTGPMVLSEEVNTLAQIGKDIPMVVIGLFNANYVKNKRYPDALSRHSNSHTSLCDFDHHVLSKKYKSPRPRKERAANPYCEVLGIRLLKILEDFPALISLALHDDFAYSYEKAGYGKTHIYSDGQMGTSDPVAKRCVEVLANSGINLRMNTNSQAKERTVGGISTMSNGSFENFLAAKKLIVNGRLVEGPQVPICITIETPIRERNHRISIDRRLAAQAAIIREIPNLLYIYQANKEKYSH
ncbi:MAG: hypothetical protein AAB506_02950, partial [Patescibacteria group bacterium]